MKQGQSSDFIRKILAIIITIIVVGVMVFLITWSPKDEQASYETYTVTKQDIQKSLELSGMVTKILIDNEEKQVIQLYVNEIDINDLSTEQSVDIELRAYEDQKYTGIIHSIASEPRITGDISEYEVMVRFDEIPEELRNGMHGTVSVVLASTEDVLAVPNESLYQEEDEEHYHVDKLLEERRVYLKKLGVDKKDQTLEPVEVEIGFEGNEYTEITSGLKDGDIIVTQ